MFKLIILLLHIIRNLILVCKPQGTKALIAENLLLRKQLIVLSRKYKRIPNLSFWDRLSFAIFSSFINPKRLFKIAIVIKPATLLKFHQALIKQKYRLLFSAKSHKKPGPKGPEKEIIKLIIEMKQRNPRFGYLRIAMQIQNAFGIEINKDVVRRVLEKHFRPSPNDQGPSWLTFIGNMKDSLWSMDLFRCESLLLKTHWIMLVMDQFTRRMIGFAVHSGEPNGIAVCCMFNKIISNKKFPIYLSSDNDPLFEFYRWKANLRILEIKEIKALPYVPLSHPFIERMIKNIRNELLDQILFWNAIDLERKLNLYQSYYNNYRSHQSLKAATPNQNYKFKLLSLNHYQWKSYNNGLVELPAAA